MLDHNALISKIPSKTKTFLTSRSDVAGLTQLAGHLGALALTSLCLVHGPPCFQRLAMVPHSILLTFLFALSHECTHFTPFRSRWLCSACGNLVAFVLVLPFTWFRFFHLAHHKHTNDPARDPELECGPRPNTVASWLTYLSGWGYWRAMLATVCANAQGDIAGGSPRDASGGANSSISGGDDSGPAAPPLAYVPQSFRGAVVLEARCLLAGYAVAAVAAGRSAWAADLLWRLWVLPALLGQPVLRAYLLAEHGLCPAVANMLANSRTTSASALLLWVTWNMPFHAEHHAYPAVPFHRLPDLHAWAEPHLASTSESYAAFTRDYLASVFPRQKPP